MCATAKNEYISTSKIGDFKLKKIPDANRRSLITNVVTFAIFFDEHVVNFASRDVSRREMKQDETVKDPLIDQIKTEIN